MIDIRIEGLDEFNRALKRLPREIERELGRVRVSPAASEHEVQRQASRAVDRAIRKAGFGMRLRPTPQVVNCDIP